MWQFDPFLIADSRFFESATSRTTAAGEDALTRPGCGWPLPHLVSSECEKPFCRRFATWLRKSSACSLNADRSSSIVRVNSSEPSGAAITFAHRAAIRSLISISIGGERAVGCQTNSLHGIQKIIHHDRVVSITPSWVCFFWPRGVFRGCPSPSSRSTFFFFFGLTGITLRVGWPPPPGPYGDHCCPPTRTDARGLKRAPPA